MIKMLLPLVVLTLLIWGSFQIIPQIPKEMRYNYIKIIFSVLTALIVAVGIIFVFVQLF